MMLWLRAGYGETGAGRQARQTLQNSGGGVAGVAKI